VDKRIIICPDLVDPRPHNHSHAVLAGNLIFVSGLISKRDDMGVINGTSHGIDGTITHEVLRQFDSYLPKVKSQWKTLWRKFRRNDL